MLIYVSLLVAILGAVIYLVSANPKIGQLAIWAWGAGLLAFLLQIVGSHSVSLMGK
jgi:hypothetical protein